jgi:LysM repeat protein
VLQEETPASLLEETSTPEPSIPSPAEIIEAVNNLRILNGLNVLAVHPVLMEVAAQQANALAASEGAVGHQRPCGMTLGQDLLMQGFALWGDLSQDGYRSENWGTASSAEEIVTSWMADELHANTMLSPHRSHLGAAVAVSKQVYIVLETALQTNSGQMQHTAYGILTGIPGTRAACIGLSTQHAEYGNLSQYSIPVAMSSARPDGDVIHEVQYGQTLWSIAIQYSTTIEQIKRLNNLTSDIIAPGWTLLIQKGATQPAPPTKPLATFELIKQDLRTPTPRLSFTPAVIETSPSINAGQFIRDNSMVVFAFVLSFSVFVAALVGFGKRKVE